MLALAYIEPIILRFSVIASAFMRCTQHLAMEKTAAQHWPLYREYKNYFNPQCTTHRQLEYQVPTFSCLYKRTRALISSDIFSNRQHRSLALTLSRSLTISPSTVLSFGQASSRESSLNKMCFSRKATKEFQSLRSLLRKRFASLRRSKVTYDIEREDGPVDKMTWSSPKVEAVALFAATRMRENEGSHDFKHVLRVHHLAMILAKQTIAAGTPVDEEVVEMAALLHDVFDSRINNQEPDAATGIMLTMHFLSSIAVPDDMVGKVTFIADNISYSKQVKNYIPRQRRSIEMDIVQDADRLDAIGAIGVARCFAYGGHAGHKMEKSRRHFNEKIVKLASLMQTTAGAKMAARRQPIVSKFLKEFDDEYALVGQDSTLPIKMTSNQTL